AAEILKFQIELGRINQRVHWGESYDLTAHDLDPVSLGEKFDEFFDFEELALVIVSHVHRYLYDSAFFQFEAESLDVRDAAILRQCYAVVHGCSGQRYERDYVYGSHARMLALMFGEVDELNGLP